ncbi:hypothetical protein QBC39DRAFT_339461 [Podospora conica]|nr:hypothetical protein QBC39DRAFT_339461 [Schizothecium conicum]
MAPPPTFVPIKPAPVPIAPSLPSAKRPNPGDTSELGKKHPKRFKAVTQACNTCRRNKAKCDGARPRCGGCEIKGRQCQYEGEEGQSRQEAMKTRLAALEKLVGALQSKSPEEATMLLRRMRTVDDIVSLSDIDTDSTSEQSVTAGSAVTDIVRTSSSQTFSQSASSSTGSDGQLIKANSNRGTMDNTACLIRLMIPSAQQTLAAIRSFYSSSGKLFHVFTQEQADGYYRSIFGLEGIPNTSQKVAIACICSIAAVGVQYNALDFDKDADLVFYDIARHFFVNTVEESPLDAVKVCAMLTMYNIMNKTTVALAFVEVGMGLSQRWASNTSICLPPPKRPEWDEYRRTWRALLFYSNWLASTLGYISGSSESAFQKLVPLATPDDDPDYGIVEIVQVEMTKIALLNAEILKLHLAFKDLTRNSMHAIQQTLQHWHSKLPEEMYLSNLSRQDLATNVRRAIFHVHLLYLGAVMLLYRRIASQLIQSSSTRADKESGRLARDRSPQRPDRESLLQQAEKGIVAAKHSARILGLLLAEQGVFKRCWLVIFQSHTSCVLILHSVAQKQLHKLPSSCWAEDLKQAQLCLDTLEFCGTMDQVALKYHVRLSGIYSNLAGRSSPELNTRQRTEDWVITMPPDLPPMGPFRDAAESAADYAPPDYLVSIPPSADKKLSALARSLLDTLCSPFGDSSDGQQGEGCGARALQGEGSRPKQKAWGMAEDQILPFSWDTSGLGMKPSADIAGGNRFLESESPNGWVAAADAGDG